MWPLEKTKNQKKKQKTKNKKQNKKREPVSLLVANVNEGIRPLTVVRLQPFSAEISRDVNMNRPNELTSRQ